MKKKTHTYMCIGIHKQYIVVYICIFVCICVYVRGVLSIGKFYFLPFFLLGFIRFCFSLSLRWFENELKNTGKSQNISRFGFRSVEETVRCFLSCTLLVSTPREARIHIIFFFFIKHSVELFFKE